MVNYYTDEIGGVLSGYQAAHPISVRLNGGGGVAADRPITSSECYCAGLSLRETAGAVAVIELYAGPDANSELLAVVSLAAAGSETIALPGRGIYCASGIFLHRVSGTVTGAVWVREPAA